MKQILSLPLFILVFLAFAFVTDVLGQERVLSLVEYLQITQQADRKLLSGPYRLVISRNEFSAGKLISAEKSVMERLSCESGRKVSIVKTASGVKRTEMIWIDGKVYTKEDSNDWKETPATGGRGTGSGSGQVVKETVEYKFKGTETLNNQKADVYESINKFTFPAEKIPFEESTRHTYWISENGVTLREEEEFTRKSVADNYRTIKIWDFEPNAKINSIVAPIK